MLRHHAGLGTILLWLLVTAVSALPASPARFPNFLSLGSVPANGSHATYDQAFLNSVLGPRHEFYSSMTFEAKLSYRQL